MPLPLPIDLISTPPAPGNGAGEPTTGIPAYGVTRSAHWRTTWSATAPRPQTRRASRTMALVLNDTATGPPPPWPFSAASRARLSVVAMAGSGNGRQKCCNLEEKAAKQGCRILYAVVQ
ncbi:uncharacterized protein LOC127756939 [Oryza glaberrima]|uniref:uncharacterized protein LOC127756939 n=1 Tax=Oryza glaberrima TaxID=4538 RepID=UPI00224C124D|nr:uncharacterized protein LOC127756939 [Oryza glaberrima]